jgi:hypothetical protein
LRESFDGGFELALVVVLDSAPVAIGGGGLKG